MNAILADPKIRDQISAAMRVLDERHRRALCVPLFDATPDHVIARLAALYAEELTGTHLGMPVGADESEELARTIVNDLIGASDAEQPTFWASPLGRACAWWIGYHRPAMPRSAAGAALGFPTTFARQRVAQMLRTGELKLPVEPDLAGLKNVTAVSLRDEMRRRWPA